MALKTSLRPIIRGIAGAIEAYAAVEGFSKSDYALAGTWDERTDRISLVFGTDRRIDERRWYVGLLQSIRESLSDYPWMVRNIGLIVENVEDLDEVYLHFAGVESESDLTDLLERASSRK